MFIKTSIDGGFSWGDWIDISKNINPLFDGEGFSLLETYFQYKVVLRNDSYDGKSPVFEAFKLELTGGYKIQNNGDIPVYPELWITKKNGSGDIRIINKFNGKVLEMKDLNNGETVYLNGEEEDIITDLPMTYRFENHNREFLRLDVGDNILVGEGDFDLDVRVEFKTLQG